MSGVVVERRRPLSRPRSPRGRGGGGGGSALSKQPHSHLRGALNVGALPADVEVALAEAERFLDEEARGAAAALWERVQKAVEGVQTQDQPYKRLVPTTMNDMTLHVEGLGWHGPIPVVGAPNRSCDYGVVAPPRAWDRGIPGTRAIARVAAHRTPSTAFLRRYVG
jgi:hypothetical protein